jgi:hypothetical protein
LLPGLIVFGNEVYTYDCIIRGLSSKGARIVVAQKIQIPERFYLINIRDGVAYDAYVVWRNRLRAPFGDPADILQRRGGLRMSAA